MKIEVEIPWKTIDNAIYTGASQGIGYWGRLKMSAGEWVAFECYDLDPPKEYRLTKEDWTRAVTLMANPAGKLTRHFQALVSDNADCETGDVLIQLAVFGELKYG